MIWGKTHKEKMESKRIKSTAKRLRQMEWRPYFVWFPLQHDDGRWIWLETIERRKDYKTIGFHDDFCWKYRFVKKPSTVER